MEFMEQLEALRPQLIRTLLRAGAKDDAEDVAQDALIRAFRKKDQFRGESALSTWVTRIALRCFWMRLRDRMRKSTVNIDPALTRALERVVDSSPSPYEHAVNKENAARLIASIAQLPFGQRNILVRQLMKDETYGETQKYFGTTESNIKSQAFKGRAKVRVMMGIGA